jgi:hypothetical protein
MTQHGKSPAPDLSQADRMHRRAREDSLAAECA